MRKYFSPAEGISLGIQTTLKAVDGQHKTNSTSFMEIFLNFIMLFLKNFSFLFFLSYLFSYILQFVNLCFNGIPVIVNVYVSASKYDFYLLAGPLPFCSLACFIIFRIICAYFSNLELCFYFLSVLHACCQFSKERYQGKMQIWVGGQVGIIWKE